MEKEKKGHAVSHGRRLFLDQHKYRISCRQSGARAPNKRQKRASSTTGLQVQVHDHELLKHLVICGTQMTSS
jgi:hypothetical protein